VIESLTQSLSQLQQISENLNGLPRLENTNGGIATISATAQSLSPIGGATDIEDGQAAASDGDLLPTTVSSLKNLTSVDAWGIQASELDGYYPTTNEGNFVPTTFVQDVPPPPTTEEFGRMFVHNAYDETWITPPVPCTLPTMFDESVFQWSTDELTYASTWPTHGFGNF